jgi:hypothetical protein
MAMAPSRRSVPALAIIAAVIVIASLLIMPILLPAGVLGASADHSIRPHRRQLATAASKLDSQSFDYGHGYGHHPHLTGH